MGNVHMEATQINYRGGSKKMSVEYAFKAVADELDSLKSGFTNLDTEVNGDATTYPYADVITIPDAVPSNLADCSVKIEPVQDLHGYDKPWVGGAGKNKFNKDSSGNIANARISTTQGNTYAANGYTVSHYIPITAGTKYVITASNSFVLYYAWYTTNNVSGFITGNSLNSGDYITAPENAQYIRFDFQTTDADTVQFEEGQTATDYAPYTNICPITGHTEVDVQRDGKNLFRGYYEYNSTTEYSPLLPSTQYTISAKSDGSKQVNYQYIYKDNSFGGNARLIASGSTSGSVTVTTPDNVKGINIYTVGISSVSENIAYDGQVELGSSASDYELYQGKTYTIALGDTIYGGTVDFDSGVMTVDRAIVDLGDLTWLHEGANSGFWANDLSPVRKLLSTDAICSAYEVYNQEVALIANAPSGKVSFQTDNNARVIIKDLSYNDSTAFTAAVTGQKLCYELATPTTIQLTPQQIQLLKGTNTLTASTGDISVTVNGVNGAIGSVQEQVNELAEQLPNAPTTDGTYSLQVTVADGTPTYSWVSGS